MTKEEILAIIRNGVHDSILTADDIFVEASNLYKNKLKDSLVKSGGKIVFKDNMPRLATCCFDGIMEVDVKNVALEDEKLIFHCVTPDAQESYELCVDDFLAGELRHVFEQK